MIFIRDAKTDAEKVYVLLKNVSGGTIPAGGAVVWASTTGSNFGSEVTKPTTATLGLFVGCADAAIVADAWGLIQVYGYDVEALVIDAVGQAITAGDILIPVNGQWYLTRSGAADGKSGFVHAGQDVAANASPAAALRKVFLR